jgi:multiple sugar transport system ATP-binding protein
MSVYDNMAFGLKLRKVPKEIIDQKVKAAAQILGITDYLSRKPKALSGGQRQRVALGRTIVREPKVFLLDEPLSNLDAKLRASMRTEISKLHTRLATTFIYVTHDQIEAMTMGTRIVVMKDGFMQQVDTPQNLYDYPINLFVASFIGTPQMNFFKGSKLVKENDSVYVTFVGNNKIKLPDAIVARIKNIDEYLNTDKEVTLGVRPDHTSITETGIEAKVDVSEMMGSSVHLHVTTADGRDVVIIVPTVDMKGSFSMGDTVHFSFGGNVVHVFSKETEKNLEW